ncbi:MAG: sel1 repeat family protein [Fibromonadaceae bacterium]|nr:sel1 repeat family protein [Fibromonadaceae bacterium]
MANGIEYFIQAAEQGEAPAQYNLGVSYQFGRGVQSCSKTAAYWYAKAAEQGFAAAQYNLANLYQHGAGVYQSKEKAKYWFSKAAEQGFKDSQTRLKDLEGCYVATAVYGSYDAPEVLCLRQFRDKVLVPSIFGRLFISLYYRFSPPIAERLKEAQRINMFVRKVLDKVVGRLNKKKHNQNEV